MSKSEDNPITSLQRGHSISCSISFVELCSSTSCASNSNSGDSSSVLIRLTNPNLVLIIANTIAGGGSCSLLSDKTAG